MSAQPHVLQVCASIMDQIGANGVSCVQSSFVGGLLWWKVRAVPLAGPSHQLDIFMKYTRPLKLWLCGNPACVCWMQNDSFYTFVARSDWLMTLGVNAKLMQITATRHCGSLSYHRHLELQLLTILTDWLVRMESNKSLIISKSKNKKNLLCLWTCMFLSSPPMSCPFMLADLCRAVLNTSLLFQCTFCNFKA